MERGKGEKKGRGTKREEPPFRKFLDSPCKVLYIRCNNASLMNLSGYVGHVTIFS